MEDQIANNVDKYTSAINAITTEQSKIVGAEVAFELAESVNGLTFKNKTAQITGDPKTVLADLVSKYSLLFGKISIEVSKTAIEKLTPHLEANELPENLR